MRLTRGGLVFLFAGLLLGGCASLPQDDSVQVSLAGMNAGESTPLETSVDFEVRVQNARPDPITVTGAAYRVFLDGNEIGEGLSDERIEVPRLSDGTEHVTVRLHNLALLRTIVAVSKQQSMNYELRSTLYLESGGHTSTFRSTKKGSLDFKDFSPAGLGSP